MKVKLIKPHTHDGKDFNAGETLDVDASTAQWLADNGVIPAKVTPVSEPETTAKE